jgi:hypothetical protein
LGVRKDGVSPAAGSPPVVRGAKKLRTPDKNKPEQDKEEHRTPFGLNSPIRAKPRPFQKEAAQARSDAAAMEVAAGGAALRK